MDSWGKLNKFTFTDEAVFYSGKMLRTANYNRRYRHAVQWGQNSQTPVFTV